MDLEVTRLQTNINVNQNSSLFSFELNFDSLKVFLDKTTATINQHAQLINALQLELEQRQKISVLPQQLAVLSEGGKIMNGELEKIIVKQTANSLKEEENTSLLISSTNKIFNKLTCLGYAVSHNYKESENYPTRFTKIEETLDNKADDKKIKEKRKKMKAKVYSTIEETKKSLENKILQLDLKMIEKFGMMKEENDKVEKKTLWKIQECEEMLKARVTEDFVNDSIKLMDERIKRESSTVSQIESEKNEKIASDLTYRMKQLEDIQAEKNRVQKKMIKDLELHVENSCAKEQLFQEFKNETIEKMEALLKRQTELNSAVQIQPILDRQSTLIQSTENKIGDIQNNLSLRINELAAQISIITRNRQNEILGSDSLGIDPHKLCQIETNVGETIENLKKQQNEFEDFKRSLLNRMNNLDLNVFQAGISIGDSNSAGGSGGGGQIPSLITEDLGNLKIEFQIVSEKLSQINQRQEDGRQQATQLKDLLKKMESISELERRLSKIMKDINFNEVQRSMKSKVDQDDFARDYFIVNENIKKNMEQIGTCRKDIDKMISVQRKLLSSMSNNSPSTEIQSILSSKKLTPISQLNCISCGSNNKQHKIKTSLLHTTKQVPN